MSKSKKANKKERVVDLTLPEVVDLTGNGNDMNEKKGEGSQEKCEIISVSDDSSDDSTRGDENICAICLAKPTRPCILNNCLHSYVLIFCLSNTTKIMCPNLPHIDKFFP